MRRIGARRGIFLKGFRSVSYDSSASAYFAAASITNTSEKTAWNNFVVSSKAANLWTGRVVRIYPASPTSLSAARYCAKTLLQRLSTSYNPPTHSALGLTYNGFNQVLELDGLKSLTNLTSEGLSNADYTIMIYVNSITPPAADAYFCGTVNDLDAGAPLVPFGDVAVGKSLSGGYTGYPQTSGGLGTVATANGLISLGVGISEIESGASQLTFDGVLDASDVLGVEDLAVEPFFTGGGAAGVFLDPETKQDVYSLYKGINYREAFMAIYSPHLTSAEETTIYSIIQTYQTALGRQA